jgi:ATP-dependent HslUV protease subunit HslV
LMISADKERLFLISGNGDVIEPDEGVIGIGSGGVAAQAAASALIQNTALEADQVARAAMAIAARLCVFTNDYLTMEEMDLS